MFTRNIQEADIILVNTCGFNGPSQRLSISLINDILKKCPPKAKVIPLGCLVQIDKQRLQEKFKDLYMVERFAQLDVLNGIKKPFHEISHFHYDHSLFNHINYRRYYIGSYLTIACCRLFKVFKKSPFSQILEEEVDENKIFVQIGLGCLNECSYCVIKKARGRTVSRPIPDIIKEIRSAYRQEASLNLVADDCGSYGFERGDDLFKLMYTINREYPGVPLELSYVHPRWIEQYYNDYLEAFKKLNITNINVSLESGSDQVLASMRRGYSANKILRILAEIKKISPTTMLWGHFLIGYPTEKWRDFYLTLKATRYYDFYYTFFYTPVEADDLGKHRHVNHKYLLKRLIFHFNLYYRLLHNLLR